MLTQTQHRMERAGAHASGAEEWACPTCGRRLLVQAHPTLAMAVLAPGDARAGHYGGIGGAPAPEPHAGEGHHAAGGAGGDDEIPLELLRPWLKALKAIEDEGLAL